jgi:hypothetical protein
MDYTIEVLRKCKEYGFKVRRLRRFRSHDQLVDVMLFLPVLCRSSLSIPRSTWTLTKTSYAQPFPTLSFGKLGWS